MDDVRITGHVAQVLNDRELVINRGALHGVEVGMRFAVLSSSPVEVFDPETGDPLGRIDRPKVIVKVSMVEIKYAITITYRTKEVGGQIFKLTRGTFGVDLGPPRQIEETLRADTETKPQPLSPEESVVHREDRVVQVVGDEFSGWDW